MAHPHPDRVPNGYGEFLSGPRKLSVWLLLIGTLVSCEKSVEPQINSTGRPGQNQPGFVLIERIFDGMDENGLFVIQDERITPVSFREAYFVFWIGNSREYVSIPFLIDWSRARNPRVPTVVPLITVRHGALHIYDPSGNLVRWSDYSIGRNLLDRSSLVYSVAVLVEVPE